MLLRIKHLEDVEHGPKTLMDAADKIKDRKEYNFLKSESQHLHRGGWNDMNGSDIQSAIIENVGRFCERYASDVICTFIDLQPFLAGECKFKNDRWIIGIGIREDGVDHNTYIMSNLKNSVHEPYGYVHTDMYRKLLVVDVKDEIRGDGVLRTIDLKDVTHEILRLSPEDEEDKDNA